LDNTLINYNKAAEHWAQKSQLGQIDSVESLKEFYRQKGDYVGDWLVVQEWLYTEGLNFANLAPGTIEVLKTLQNYGLSVIIVSHKSNRSAKSYLDLHTPAREWLAGALREVDFDLGKDLFLEEDRSKKISRIREERVTYFVDDLLEVFLEPEFPREIKGFWLKGKSSESAPVNVTAIQELNEILQHV